MKKLLLFLFMPTMAYTANLPNNAKFETLTDFSGGLVTTLPSHKIANNYSPYLRNVFIDDGRIESINGFVHVGSTNTLSQVTGIFPYYLEDGRKFFLVTDSSVTLETADFNSYVFVSSGSNTGGLLNWIQVRNKMWGFNGIDPVMTWDHSVKTILNGSNGTPDVPKFKYGAYYQDRVFGYGLPTAASDLVFSATITTDNVTIAPDDSRAWPANYLLHVGQGDGQIATAMWEYEGLLRLGKEHSIYTLYGNLPTNYDPKKEESGNGVISNESVVVMDGASHFVDDIGIYKNTERISDLVVPDFNLVNKGISRIISDTWETNPEFITGNFSGSTVTADGFLTFNNYRYQVNFNTYTTASLLPKSSSFTIPSGSYSSGFAAFSSTNPVPGNLVGYVPVDPPIVPISIQVWGMSNGACGPQTSYDYNITATLKNLRTGLTSEYNNPMANFSCLNFGKVQIYGKTSQTPLFEASDLANGNMTIKLDVVGTQPLTIFPATGTGFSDIFLFSATTAQYVSQVSTITTLVAWGNYDSEFITNGGAIEHYIRTSTSVVNIATQAWSSITPGAVVNAPLINKYVQWAATITSVSSIPVTGIENVTISHVEGAGALSRPFAINWKNRYWLAVTTNSDLSMTMVYVKSKSSNANPDAWMPIEGYNFRSFAKDGDTFYGGSASTGIVYRLDYGTNYDGRAFQRIYDTPDMVLGDYFFDKNIYKYVFDGERTAGGTITVGTSKDGGAFSNRTFSIDGDGRYSYVMEGVTGQAKTLRLRLSNGVLDQPFKINSIAVINGISDVLK